MHYKPLTIIPLLLLAFGIAWLTLGFLETGEWFERSIDLKGGTLITLQGVAPGDVEPFVQDGRVRELSGFAGQGVIIEIPVERDADAFLEALEDAGISTRDVSLQTVGPSLGESFWRQAQIAISLAFVFMGAVVFFLFRKLVPSFAVIFAAFADIIVTLAFMQIFGIPLSLAGMAALLMLIGYSVDTDILLTSRMFKDDGSLTQRLRGALKTGLTMNITTLAVLLTLVIGGISPVITQIATVLLIGLVLDLVNTWFMNAGMLRWYMERRGAT